MRIGPTAIRQKGHFLGGARMGEVCIEDRCQCIEDRCQGLTSHLFRRNAQTSSENPSIPRPKERSEASISP